LERWWKEILNILNLDPRKQNLKFARTVHFAFFTIALRVTEAIVHGFTQPPFDYKLYKNLSKDFCLAMSQQTGMSKFLSSNKFVL